jgi:N-acetylglucosamine kinase-like BadF-type ATPase
MSLRVIGVDAGGTETFGYLADEQGRILAEAHDAGANFHTSGPEAVEAVLRSVFQGLVGPEAPCLLAAVCVGMAGVDREDEADAIRAIIRRIGCQAPTVVVNDGLIALHAGVGDRPGVVVISGTGSIVYGYNSRFQAARAGGWGHIIGDEGSRYWIGREALTAVVRAADGRGPATRLTVDVLEHFKIDDVAGLTEIVYDRDWPRMSVAALGPLVQRALESGDHLATSIVERAAEELVSGARSVVSRLRLDEEMFPAVLAGGAFQAVPALVGAVTTRLVRTFPQCQVRRLAHEPALGAVHLALAMARGQLNLPKYL